MVLCVVVIVLIVFAMIAVTIIIYTQSRIVNLVYAGICVVLFSLVRQGGIGITCSGSGRQFKLNSAVHYVLLETWRGHYFNFVLYSVPPLILGGITKLIKWKWPLVQYRWFNDLPGKNIIEVLSYLCLKLKLIIQGFP